MSIKSIMMAFSAIFFTFAAISCADNGSEYSCSEFSVLVERGDTLWSIAENNCTGDIGYVVDLLNEKYGTTIYPTQSITLP